MQNRNKNSIGFITAYCSHSYKENDIPVNLYFWNLFSEQGIMFSVDPKSDFLSIPYLEKMMQNSSCFVAIIPFRPEQKKTRCSPFILFENGIAIHQNKPKLILLESRISEKYFGYNNTEILVFNRYNLHAKEHKFIFAISELVKKAKGNTDFEAQLHSKVLFILDKETHIKNIYTKKIIKLIENELEDLGYELKVYIPEFNNTHEFCQELNDADFIIIEQRIDLISPWITSFIHARAVPSIRACYIGDLQTRDEARLTPLLMKYSVLISKSVFESVIHWDRPATLLNSISPHLNKLEQQRVILDKRQVGDRYFKSIGREDTLVFISFADETKEIVTRLSNALKIENINFFQYKEKDAIQIGKKWQEELETKLNESKIFVALIDHNYLNKEWCTFEMNIAENLDTENKIRILPYFLTKTIPTALEKIEGREVYDMSRDDLVKTIVEDVDNALRKKS